jgi:hypothetical protein
MKVYDPGACEEQLNNAGNEASKEKTLVLPKRKKKATLQRVWMLFSTNVSNLQQPIFKGWL